MSSTNPTPPTRTHWHATDLKDVLADWRVDPQQGLDEAAVLAARERYGANGLPPPARLPAWLRFLRQFHNLLIYVLIVAAVLVAALDHILDALVIGVVVLANALIGYLQEGKAEKALDAIGSMLAPTARVRRGGRDSKIASTELVPGDLVLLKAGDRVPADLRLIEVHDLSLDEAALTGESLPVSKAVDTLAAETALAERRNLAFSGTLVRRGSGSGVVIATAQATEIGRITRLLAGVQTLTTPLLQQIERFGRSLSVVILVVAGALFALAWFGQGQSLQDSVLAAVALAVAAIPEGLPAIITITLAVGVQRMAARKAIVRRLPAVETLGAVSVICSDKTGTLTRNEMAATQIGLEPGLLVLDGPCPDAAHELLQGAILASEAEQAQAADPLEAALYALAEGAGIDAGAVRRDQPRHALLPFSSDNKLMALRRGDSVYLKGAPERVLARCENQGSGARIDGAHWTSMIAAMAGQGLRVLAIAQRAQRGEQGALALAELGTDFRLLGLIGFSDPPRAEVAEAIRACQQAGIRVKMITGDHVDTALAIAAKIGLQTQAGALAGPELDAMNAEQLTESVGRVDVYARASPENKLHLVEALQRSGQVVAMTGDGVNDAPALKRADIGVAMGQKGTEAAREAAEIVLADDHFATIVAGVEEGRGVYDNIRKALMFILPTNAAEAMVILAAVTLGMALPITPVQILWINTVTAITLALALAFEPLERNVMRRPPRPMRSPLVSVFVGVRILWVGALVTGFVFLLYLWSLADGDNEAVARTVALNTLVFCELTYLFNVRRWVDASYTPTALFDNGWAWIAAAALVLLQLLATYLPIANQVLGTAPIGWDEWGEILIAALLLFAVVESEKALLRRRRRV